MRKPTGPYEEADIPEGKPPEYLLAGAMHLPGYYLMNSDGLHCSAAYESPEQIRCCFGPMYGHPKEAKGRWIAHKDRRYKRKVVLEPA